MFSRYYISGHGKSAKKGGRQDVYPTAQKGKIVDEELLVANGIFYGQCAYVKNIRKRKKKCI